MKSVIDQAIETRAAKTLGAKGGKSGRGKAKARTSEQARAAANARWEKERANEEMAKEHNANRNAHDWGYWPNNVI